MIVARRGRGLEEFGSQFSLSKTPKGSGDSNNCMSVCMSVCMERICNYSNLNFNCLGQLIPFSKNFRGVIFPFKFDNLKRDYELP